MELDLALLLRLAWTVQILAIVAASLPFSGFIHRFVMLFASRGKIVKSPPIGKTREKGWINLLCHSVFNLILLGTHISCICYFLLGYSGRFSHFLIYQSCPLRRFTVPQQFFSHFYMLAVILTTCLLVLTWFYAYAEVMPLYPELWNYSTITSHLTGGSHIFSYNKEHSPTLSQKHKAWQTVFLLLLMEIQVLRRLHETLNVFHYSRSARQHIFGHLTGLFYYVITPISLASPCITEAVNFLRDQIAEFVVKGRDRFADLSIDPPGLVRPLLSLGGRQWIGGSIFFWGWLHQLRCHSILGSLRENKTTDEYVIPYGDWFKYVSCPHFFAEMVIYAGILVASGGHDITVWLLFIFVVSNLSFAAAETHRWYKQKFEDYPRNRRAIIPFIY